MPPDSSTGDVQRADDARPAAPVGAAAERGVEVDQVDPLGAVALPGQRRVERVAVAGLGAGLALDEADRLAVGDVDGGQKGEAHAGEGTGRGTLRTAAGHPADMSRAQPTTSRSQLPSTVAPASPDFSGWNWVADSAPFSTAATNSLAVLRPGHERRADRVRRLQLPAAHAVGVHEVEARPGLHAGEQRRPGRRRDGVPAHVRQHVRLEPLDGARPLPAALGALVRARRRARTAPACRRRCRAPAGRRRAAGR